MSKRKDKMTEGRYHLRRGIAKVALQAKVTGQTEVDCVGRPLLHANNMANQVGINQISKWARGVNSTAVAVSGMEFCKVCHCVPEYCNCPKEGKNGRASSSSIVAQVA